MHLSTYMYVHVLYMNSPNYLQRGIFFLGGGEIEGSNACQGCRVSFRGGRHLKCGYIQRV